MRKITKIVLLLICASVFIFSAYKIYDYIAQESANRGLNNELLEKAVTEIPNVNVIEDVNEIAEGENSTLPISVDFSALQKESKDIIGWLYIENSQINYPVVKSVDNEYYLHRLINGEYNVAGSIFMDYRNSSNLQDNNTIIYGHNMKNDTMFGTLQEYKNQEYYEEHKNIYYFTPEKNYIIELFTGFTVSADSDIYNLSTIDEKERKNLIENSDFKADVELNENDKIITLSTCAYEYEDARYMVMGVLK